MNTAITKDLIEKWEKLVDCTRTGERLQALTFEYVNNNGYYCEYEDAEQVCFMAYDYDYKHDYSILKSTLSAIGIPNHFIKKEEQWDFSGDIFNNNNGTTFVVCRVYALYIDLKNKS